MSNLPPGITDSMIPGNRPEDAAVEQLADELGDKLSDLLESYDVDIEAMTNDPRAGQGYDLYDRAIECLTELIVLYRREVEQSVTLFQTRLDNRPR